MSKKLSQTTIYLIYSGASALFFSMVFTVSQLYRIDTLHLNPLQLVLVGTVLEASCFVFEVPTGVVADMKSRKLSVIIGLLLIGTAFILEGSVPLFAAVIVSQFLWGLGYTFTSGADEAWIADELEGKSLDWVYLKGAQMSQLASFIGILLSTVIGVKLMNLPIIIGGVLFIMLSVFLMFFMKEENFKPAPAEDRNSWMQMRHTFMEGIKFIKGSKVLVLMMSIALLYGLYSEGFDRLWTAHLQNDIGFPNIAGIKPIVWIGIIDGTAMLISILAVEYIKRRMEKTGELDRVWILTLINILMVAAVIFFGFSGNFTLALSMYLLFYILRTTNGPIYSAWRNKNIKSEVRATVISTYGQIDALGQIIGGPIIGFIALKTSISAAIVVSGIILSPVVVLLIMERKK
ncbi:MFS transporter [Clostridium swellfunianum]|uniref:MFS transporter n=1 Tax=Clostridium swellfunianum TaxID=1367462 RepID=UPI00202ED177|nr:MFS transporter [Clostridium swellfunianum]MCM0647200.1 MFS transporter [Clostridium swellfunianum]